MQRNQIRVRHCLLFFCSENDTVFISNLLMSYKSAFVLCDSDSRESFQMNYAFAVTSSHVDFRVLFLHLYVHGLGSDGLFANFKLYWICLCDLLSFEISKGFGKRCYLFYYYYSHLFSIHDSRYGTVADHFSDSCTVV